MTDRRTAMLVHASVPFFGFVVPLVGWYALRPRTGWLRDVVTEALNFSLAYTVVMVAAIVSVVFIVGIVVVPTVGLAALFLCGHAAVVARLGQSYRFPVALPVAT